MFRSLILFSLLIIAYSVWEKINGCSCEEIENQNDCDYYYPNGNLECIWNVEKHVCESYPKVECFLETDSESCRNNRYCGWVNNKCVDFKQCSDYKETVDQKCNDINYRCYLGKDNQCGRMQCEEYTPKNCDFTYNTDIFCVLSGDPRTCVPMTACELANSEGQCAYKFAYSCVWTGSSCREKQCSDFQGQCGYLTSINQTIGTYCYYPERDYNERDYPVRGGCVEISEEYYTEENCFAKSFKGRVWKNGKCQICSGILPSYNKILSIIIFLVAILIL